MIIPEFDRTFAGWREAARRLLYAYVPPDEVLWSREPALFDDGIPVAPPRPLDVPKDFLEIADIVALHADNLKWALLYLILFRIVNGEKHLLKIESDPDVHRLLAMQKQVTHDLHRMKAFVRFRRSGDRVIAWHRPDHHIVQRIAPWFVDRFGSMEWSILTPDVSAHWDLHQLTFTAGVPVTEAPTDDALEELWRAYYASTFNPARVNEDLMRTHVPGRYWAAMPETQIVPSLIVSANERAGQMRQTNPITAAAFIPANATLPLLREAVHGCRGCELHERATQPVFGEGPETAELVLVGEQPGDQEDLAGRGFVGPSGQLLDRALVEAGLERSQLYITGAVRHFRFEERGKRRIHKTASKSQVAACQPWLEAELSLLRPKLIVCMGATAILSVLGRTARVGELRQQVVPHRYAEGVTATVHPSFVLRAQSPEEEFARFVDDLRFAREQLQLLRVQSP
jgi:uracil-DNA glycosylase